jgi:hypothetical protein
MGWASSAIEKLSNGETSTVRPRGHSMTGKVNDVDTVTVAAVGDHELAVGDIVLVRCRGHQYLHPDQSAPGRTVPDRQLARPYASSPA